MERTCLIWAISELGVKTPCFIGLDIGTGSVKSVVFNRRGEVQGADSKPIRLLTPGAGKAEQDLVDIWDATRLAVRHSLLKAKVTPTGIAAVGIAGQAGGTLILDGGGRPVKMISWRDERASPIVQQLERNRDDETFRDLTGWPSWPQFSTVQLAWIAKNEPAILKHAHTVFSVSDWVAFRLTGNKRASESALIGVIDPRTKKYSNGVFALLGIERLLELYPPPISAVEVYGRVTPEAATHIALNSGTPVISAGYDVASCVAGAGGVEAHSLVCILGTSGTNALVCDSFPALSSRTIVRASHLVPHRWLAISEAISATPNLDWFIDEFYEPGSPQVRRKCDELISSIPAGSDGVIYHPYLAGETGPFVNLNAKASFFGITPQHTKAHLLRAVYEGVAFSIRDNFDHLKRAAHIDREIVLVGGGARSDVWCQIIADVLNRRIVTLKESEAGCTGAAMSAAVALGFAKSFSEAAEIFVRRRRKFNPNARAMKVYDREFSVYVALRGIYAAGWDALAGMRS